MKKVRHSSLKEQIVILTNQIKFLINQLYELQIKNTELENANAELQRDKNWLKQLVQEMSSTMNAGAMK